MNLLHPRVLVFLLTPTIILDNPIKDKGLGYQRQFYEKLLSDNQDFFEKYIDVIINVIPYKMNDGCSSEQTEFLNQVRKFQNELSISMSKKNVNRNVILLVTEHFDSMQSNIKYQLVKE